MAKETTKKRELLYKIESWQNTTSGAGYNVYLSARNYNGEKVYVRAYVPKSGNVQFEDETRGQALDGKLNIFIRRQRSDPKARANE